MIFCGVPNQGYDVFAITGLGHAKRGDLMQTTVTGIECSRKRVTENLPSEDSRHVFNESRLTKVHGSVF